MYEVIIGELIDGLKSQAKDLIEKTIKSKMKQRELDAVVQDLVDRIIRSLQESVVNSKIDLKGMSGYIQGKLLTDLDAVLKDPSPDGRKQKKKTLSLILAKYMDSEEDARGLTEHLLEVVYTFYKKDIADKDLILYADFAHEIMENDNQNADKIIKAGDKNQEELLQVTNKIMDKLVSMESMSSDKNSSELGSSDKEKDDLLKLPENRAQEYKDKWTQNLFLNNPNKREKIGNKPIELKDLYMVPFYKYKNEEDPLDDIADLLLEVAAADNCDERMLLVLGQPGSGKSSLLTYFLHEYGEMLDREIILYRFTDFSKFENLHWNEPDTAQQFLNALGMNVSDLEKKILILDGLDEISVAKAEETVEQLRTGLANCSSLKKFSLLITCRENYVKKENLPCTYITLQSLDEKQIETYYDTYKEKNQKTELNVSLDFLQKMNHIFGVPIVLYMTLASDINTNQSCNIVDIYDSIFDVNGYKGIYNVNNYKEDAHRVWLSENKVKVHEVSRRIAVWMYQYNDGKAEIPQNKYQEIITEMNMSPIDVSIGNFFKHCEGTDGVFICFVHRSIYEYFVADAIFAAVEQEVRNPVAENKKNFVKHIVPYIFKGKISVTIGEYLKYKFEKTYGISKNKAKFFHWLEEVLEEAMECGFYNLGYETGAFFMEIAKIEIRCFANMLNILQSCRVWDSKSLIWQGRSRGNLLFYIEHNTKSFHQKLDLWGFDFANTNLRKVDLSGADLCRANLIGADLRETDLSGADLSFADLNFANLFFADLNSASLVGADLSFANLNGADLTNAKLYRFGFTVEEQKQLEARGVIFEG